jgi:hypothetical protein
MPLPEIATPAFDMVHAWTVDDILGYMRTWSAYRRCLRETGNDEVAKGESRLRVAWGGGVRDVHWPLALRVARA